MLSRAAKRRAANLLPGSVCAGKTFPRFGVGIRPYARILSAASAVTTAADVPHLSKFLA
jgi:hypothetical protein